MKPARSAGVREAKARLSQLLRDVQLGREWIITERGKPVARLVPATTRRASIAQRLQRLEEIGVIEPRTRPRLPLPPPLSLESGLAQRMLDEDRGS